PVLLYVWDGVVVAFLCFWAAGLLTELQRSEILSLDKFLHLPVSLSGAFLINYVSSLLNLGMVLFVPPMLGLSVGLVFGMGPAMLLMLPLVAAFLLMVTALTYQFQGWLAALMSNPRRPRTVIVVMTIAFVLIFQLPNLINLYQPWEKGSTDRFTHWRQEEDKLEQAYREGRIKADEYQQQKKELDEKFKRQSEQEEQQTLDQVERTTRLV